MGKSRNVKWYDKEEISTYNKKRHFNDRKARNKKRSMKMIREVEEGTYSTYDKEYD